MELNAEQINDILDKMGFFQGQRAGRELWNDKPFDVQEQDIANFSRDIFLIKRYINKLTEENKKLTINMNAYGLTAKNLGEENERLREHNINLEQKLMLLGIEDVYVFKAKVKGE